MTEDPKCDISITKTGLQFEECIVDIPRCMAPKSRKKGSM